MTSVPSWVCEQKYVDVALMSGGNIEGRLIRVEDGWVSVFWTAGETSGVTHVPMTNVRWMNESVEVEEPEESDD